MRFHKNVLVIVLAFFSIPVFGQTFLIGNPSFKSINDVNREGESWAVCSATYDIMSELIGADTAQGLQYGQYANGAEVALTMALVSDGLTKSLEPKKFSALWSYAQLAGKEWPKTRMTYILAEGEKSGAKEIDAYITKLGNTMKVCMDNLETQQKYIDLWRELAKSGIVQLPTE